MSQWQTIDSAPKDRGVILCAWRTSNGKWAVYPALWRASRMYENLWGWHMISWPDLDLQLSLKPTHWMPLPAPPSTEGGTE